jgi:adenosine deaminase
MFKYCHSRFPNVKYTLHAGELTLGLVQPEELTWHINSAIYIAGANRIGHGVDIAYEANSYDLLRYMSKNNIPIEINLASNEFILKVKEGRHPFTLYKEFNVPIVISTDDAGILRTNMTEQYVLLAKRYADVSYETIKQYVYNSINYSFIQDESVKKQLIKDLDNRFKIFENQFSKN